LALKYSPRVVCTPCLGDVLVVGGRVGLVVYYP
jgi:hypothetical protein